MCAQTAIGGKKTGITNKAKYDKLYLKKYGKTYYEYIGMLGGKKGKTGGFAYPLLCDCDYKEDLHKKASCAGSKGGKVSRRK